MFTRNLLLPALLLLLNGLPAVSHADNYAVQSMSLKTGEVYEYMVSGILKKNGPGEIIKLVQSVETARSEDEASGALIRKSLKEFPGYTMATTLASKIKPSSSCLSI